MSSSETVHISCDAIGVSLLAPVGYLSEDALAEPTVTIWSGPGDEPDRDAVTIDVMRLDAPAGASMEIAVQRPGRVVRWSDDVALSVDGLAATGRRYESDGDGGPRSGVFIVVPVAFPVALRAEWPADLNRYDEVETIAAGARLLTPLDDAAGRSSVCNVALRVSAWVPTGWSATSTSDSIVIAGPGSHWRAMRTADTANASADHVAVEEDLDGDVAVAFTTGIGTLRGRATYLSETLAIEAEGDDLSTMAAITRSLRAHPFLGD